MHILQKKTNYFETYYQMPGPLFTELDAKLRKLRREWKKSVPVGKRNLFWANPKSGNLAMDDYSQQIHPDTTVVLVQPYDRATTLGALDPDEITLGDSDLVHYDGGPVWLWNAATRAHIKRLKALIRTRAAMPAGGANGGYAPMWHVPEPEDPPEDLAQAAAERALVGQKRNAEGVDKRAKRKKSRRSQREKAMMETAMATVKKARSLAVQIGRDAVVRMITRYGRRLMMTDVARARYGNGKPLVIANPVKEDFEPLTRDHAAVNPGVAVPEGDIGLFHDLNFTGVARLSGRTVWVVTPKLIRLMETAPVASRKA